MVEASWTVVQRLLDVWKALPPRDFPNYAAGSWGPDQAHELLRRDGREWRDPSHSPVSQHCSPSVGAHAPNIASATKA
jgi:hypothetical protein